MYWRSTYRSHFRERSAPRGLVKNSWAEIQAASIQSRSLCRRRTAGTMGLHAFTLLLLTSSLCISNGDQPVEEELTTPRRVQPLGGSFTLHPQSAEVQGVAKKAVEDFNRSSKSKKYFRLLNVTSAEYQVTNVINYKIDAVIGKTKCPRSEDPDLESCVLGKKMRQRKCKFEVTFNPRNDKYDFFHSSCKK
ncbi:cystatin-SN-like [Anguilla anguilla]|uniref:Cystatin domain-containing protein n=1 Tax=Anguilla anguilla TaxID=7936 RepID=A0A9D3RLC2_ANGAN|nr:cystatin-SN-like [Anguilla anguilla]KAG5834839.1 hypothetical protein ANANG_G00265850 [Anguilla anguilla]